MTTIQSGSSLPSQDLLNAVNAKTSSSSSAGGVQADTDKFMTLLVTQLKNQDPLNPLDNAQITSQLAQLSTVTGVNKLNTTLETLKSSYQSSESLQAANMIGHGVLTAGSNVELASSKSILGVDLASAADSVQVQIMDSTGKVVRTMDLGAKPAGTVPLAWDGVNDAKALMADGHYSFKVVAMQGGNALTDASALAFGTVASVSTSAKDGVKLNVPGVGAVSMADVKQIL